MVEAEQNRCERVVVIKGPGTNHRGKDFLNTAVVFRRRGELPIAGSMQAEAESGSQGILRCCRLYGCDSGENMNSVWGISVAKSAGVTWRRFYKEVASEGAVNVDCGISIPGC